MEILQKPIKDFRDRAAGHVITFLCCLARRKRLPEIIHAATRQLIWKNESPLGQRGRDNRIERDLWSGEQSVKVPWNSLPLTSQSQTHLQKYESSNDYLSRQFLIEWDMRSVIYSFAHWFLIVLYRRLPMFLNTYKNRGSKWFSCTLQLIFSIFRIQRHSLESSYLF